MLWMTPSGGRWCCNKWVNNIEILQSHTYLKEINWSKSKDREGCFQHAFFGKITVWIKYKIPFHFGWNWVKWWERNRFGNLIVPGKFLEVHDRWKLRVLWGIFDQFFQTKWKERIYFQSKFYVPFLLCLHILQGYKFLIITRVGIFICPKTLA